jgi:hypothetical protein
VRIMASHAATPGANSAKGSPHGSRAAASASAQGEVRGARCESSRTVQQGFGAESTAAPRMRGLRPARRCPKRRTTARRRLRPARSAPDWRSAVRAASRPTRRPRHPRTGAPLLRQRISPLPIVLQVFYGVFPENLNVFS